MISALVRAVLRETGLRQAELADAMGVSLDRVKSLASDRVKNLTRQESEALVAKLKIRPEWLISGGQGPMFQTQTERAQRAAASALQSARDQVDLVVRDAKGNLAFVEIKDSAEVRLIRLYRSAGAAGKKAIEATAAAVVKEPTDDHQSSVTQHFAGQVGQAIAGDVMNRGVKFDLRSTPTKKK